MNLREILYQPREKNRFQTMIKKIETKLYLLMFVDSSQTYTHARIWRHEKVLSRLFPSLWIELFLYAWGNKFLFAFFSFFFYVEENTCGRPFTIALFCKREGWVVGVFGGGMGRRKWRERNAWMNEWMKGEIYQLTL